MKNIGTKVWPALLRKKLNDDAYISNTLSEWFEEGTMESNNNRYFKFIEILKRTITHYDQFILVFLRSWFIVGPDWANFESSWCQNFLQKFVDLLGNLKTTLLKYKLLCVFLGNFWKKLG